MYCIQLHPNWLYSSYGWLHTYVGNAFINFWMISSAIHCTSMQIWMICEFFSNTIIIIIWKIFTNCSNLEDLWLFCIPLTWAYSMCHLTYVQLILIFVSLMARLSWAVLPLTFRSALQADICSSSLCSVHVSQVIKLTNVGEEPLTWALDCAGVRRLEDSTFKFVSPRGTPLTPPTPSPSSGPKEGEIGYLKPGQSFEFTVQCKPGVCVWLQTYAPTQVVHV